jgi:hypothetical protein
LNADPSTAAVRIVVSFDTLYWQNIRYLILVDIASPPSTRFQSLDEAIITPPSLLPAQNSGARIRKR